MYTFKKFKSKSIPTISRAKNEYLYLRKLGKVLDFTSGWTGFASLGHNNDKILRAIKKTTSKAFNNKIRNIKNPYGDGKSSRRIINIIKRLDLKNFNTQKKLTY